MYWSEFVFLDVVESKEPDPTALHINIKMHEDPGLDCFLF